MAYQVLARKYRPQRFSDVVGQDHVTRTLGHALEQGRIAHGYIFSGHRGIGKTTIARILAMALNCRRVVGTVEHPNPERPSYEPCGTCESCEEVRAGNSVDVIEIDAATNRGIDEIRELRDAARYRPARDRYKIYILDEAHQITDAAFNALLKTLEEPPDHVVFMMATTQPEDILQTIRSRCQHFSFHAVSFDAILEQLRAIAAEENVVAEDEALGLLAEAGDGSMRDALSIMDQAIASAPVENNVATLGAAQIRELMGSMPNAVFARLLEQVSENNAAAVLGELDRLLANGNSPSQIARQLVRYLRNVLMARIGGEGTALLQLSPDERARAAGSALLFGEEELTRFLQVMLRTFDELNYRQEQRFHLELGVLKLVHLQRLLPVEELLTQLAGPTGASRTTPNVPRSRADQTGASAQPLPPAAPKAPGTAPSASAAPAASLKATEAPAFSPFERDAQRKTAMPGTPRTQVPAERVPSIDVPAARVTPSPSGDQPPTAARSQQSPGPGPETEPDFVNSSANRAGALKVPPVAVKPETAPDPQPAAIAESSTGADTNEAQSPARANSQPPRLDLNGMRDAACRALEEGGHSTAATLLGAGVWTETPEAVRVEVAARKTMLGLTMSAEAEKLVRAAVRPYAGQPPKPLEWIPGGTTNSSEGVSRSSTDGSAAPPKPAGGVQARALENPLVQQARELFQAEVRSVVDLRGKR